LIIDAISGGKPPYAISLDGIFFEPIGAFPFVWTGLSAGAYQMTVEDSEGNAFTLDIIIPSKIQPVLNAGDDLELQLGESATLTALANFPIAEITWLPGIYLSCDTCATTSLEQPLDDISYTVTAYDEDGCLVVDILNVKIIKTRTLFAPNIFSPNFDGINDVFLLFGGRDVLLIREFQVYNRWGGRVFQASGFAPNDPAFGWDGRFKGKNMDAGVYVFYAEVEYLDGTVEIVKGGVTLVR
jgi:gliding motility-associated-like protein